MTIIPIATDIMTDPNTEPITVGMMAKNPPFAAPHTSTNAISGPRLVEMGQRASILVALMASARKRLLIGPILSPRYPNPMRPTAEERLKPATRPAPMLGDRPSEVL